MNALSLDLHALDALSAILVVPGSRRPCWRWYPATYSGPGSMSWRPAHARGFPAAAFSRSAEPEHTCSSTISTSSSRPTTFIGLPTERVQRHGTLPMRLESAIFDARYLRFYHSMYQVLMFAIEPHGAQRQRRRARDVRNRLAHAHHHPHGRHLPAPTKPSKRHRNTSSWPASASRSPCSAPS